MMTNHTTEPSKEKAAVKSLKGAGGVFLLLHALLCAGYFAGNAARGILEGSIFTAWFMTCLLLLISGTIYAFVAFSIKYENYSLLAGYQPKARYHPAGMSVYLKQVMLHTSVSSFAYSVVILFVTGMGLGGILILLYTAEFVAAILLLNHRNKGSLYLEEESSERKDP
jgi:hypothetical protein